VTSRNDSNITEITTDVDRGHVEGELKSSGYSESSPGRSDPSSNVKLWRRGSDDPMYTARDKSDSKGPTLDVKKPGEKKPSVKIRLENKK
jgi:hypothetical protein